MQSKNPVMLAPTTIMADHLGDYLAQSCRECFPGQSSRCAEHVGNVARQVMDLIGNTDALYHNVEHTMMVTIVGQNIFKGRLLYEALSPDDWMHYTCALLAHDIGYVRGVCRGDREKDMVIDEEGRRVILAIGASDACLAPYHIERGKIFAREQFANIGDLDIERIIRSIEQTRFPVPDGETYLETKTEAGLVRAADLIGQMADPAYHGKMNALYCEFKEVGIAKVQGYESPADLLDKLPEFFWNSVHPYIQPAIRYLELTTEGYRWVTSLYYNVSQHRAHSTLMTSPSACDSEMARRNPASMADYDHPGNRCFPETSRCSVPEA